MPEKCVFAEELYVDWYFSRSTVLLPSHVSVELVGAVDSVPIEVDDVLVVSPDNSGSSGGLDGIEDCSLAWRDGLLGSGEPLWNAEASEVDDLDRDESEGAPLCFCLRLGLLPGCSSPSEPIP